MGEAVSPRPAIVFVGFMGSGKSVALGAARDVGLATTEIDDVMEEAFGMSIVDAFREHGEEGFRARESELVGTLLEHVVGVDGAGAERRGGGAGGAGLAGAHEADEDVAQRCQPIRCL